MGVSLCLFDRWGDWSTKKWNDLSKITRLTGDRAGIWAQTLWSSIYSLQFSLMQSLSHVWLCDSRDCSTPGFPVLHHLPEFVQIHIHWVGDAIQTTHPLPHPYSSITLLSKHRPLLSPSLPNLLQNLSSSTVIWQLLHNALHYNFMWSSHLPNPCKVFIFWQQHNNFLETMPELGSETLDVKAPRWDFKWPQQPLDTLSFCCGPRKLSHLKRFL